MTAPKVTIERSCDQDVDFIHIDPTIHAEESVDVLVDGVLVLDDVNPKDGPFTVAVPQAVSHNVTVNYENGSWAGPINFETPMVVCEEPTTTVAAPTTTATPETTTTAAAPTTTVATPETTATTTPETTTTASTPETTTASTIADRCEEDEACWDCSTMGNKDCTPMTTTAEVVVDLNQLPATGAGTDALLGVGAGAFTIGCILVWRFSAKRNEARRAARAVQAS